MKGFHRLLAAAVLSVLPCIVSAAEAPPPVPFAAAVKQDGQWGAVNETGEVLIPLRYEAVDTTLIEQDKQAEDLAMPGRDWLIETKSHGKYGFYNREGKVIIPLSYEARSPWADGVTAVQVKKDELGFYRADGRRLAPPVYSAVSDMRNGWAIVKKDGKYGYVSREGALIDPIYDQAHYFSEGYAPVKDRKWGVIDEEGRLVIPHEYDDAGPHVSDGLLAVKRDNLWGFIDMTGAEVIPIAYREVHPTFDEHLTAVKNEDNLWGFVSSTGEVTAEPTFRGVVTPFSEGLAGVVTTDGKAYARPDGTIAFQADFDRIYAFEDGLAEYLDGRIRYVQRRPISFSIGLGFGWWGPRHFHRRHHHPFGWGLGFGFPLWDPWWYDRPSRAIEVKRGYIDRKGRLVAPAELGRVYPAEKEGIIVFNRNRFGMVDRTGQYVVHTIYRALEPVPEEGYLLARDETKKWGTLSFTGETLLPFEYSEIRPLGGGCVAAKKGGKWALVRQDGTSLTEPVYNEIGAHGEGLFPARIRGTWVYLDTDGMEALTFPEKVQDALPFAHGYGAIKVDGKWGIIAPDGAFTADPAYSDLRIL